ncbi:Clp protease N-terminal domain-containing protein [Streptomyces sp. SID3343]|uniref:Clp protease N-terminal domain-containing protein n=1 Tax=Streptomyces sp. SID3343 TaxID=2690260 RepID=UPI0013695E5F|nr:Clp protease N-terminal domain-containing protein [Streptomyces sp. SID3343]MYW05103.1 hypothetical protein [Streptomyces sp. SID3343]
MAEENSPYSPRLESILRLARATAHSHGLETTGVEHVFLAILAEPHAIPTQVLTRTGRINGLRDDLLEVLNSDLYRQGTE